MFLFFVKYEAVLFCGVMNASLATARNPWGLARFITQLNIHSHKYKTEDWIALTSSDNEEAITSKLKKARRFA